MEKIVIVGGVAAGATAAAKARRISPDAQIVMLEAGADISFANCGLPYYIGGDIKNRSRLILQSPESFREQYDVEVHIHTVVSSIDRKAHILTTTDTLSGTRKTFEYTKLILAQGGKPLTPNLPGAERDHVFNLWTLSDMDKIAGYLHEQKPRHAVVVGGGFIGLEMVEALVKRGLKVDVVEKMPHVMAHMDAETAGFIQQEMIAHGVTIHTSTSVTQISSRSVTLSNGKMLDADLVLLSVGVRPTLQLAIDAGLEIGEAGGLLVNSFLQTSDPDIYGAGDMVEIVHRVNGKKVRLPLAGPANRQGRIAAENALGGRHPYKGSIGTSIVRVFDAVAGITGLSLKQAREAGMEADAVVVHKEHHTAYYPGAETVSALLVYDRRTGVILGGQTAGYRGADKRLDVMATATAAKLTVNDLADIDLAYSPPLGTPNDVLNMAAYSAENRLSGFSPSVTVAELDQLLEGKNYFFIDVRDIFAFQKSHIASATHVPLEYLAKQMGSLPKDRLIMVYDETGKKGHQALRILQGKGYSNVINISGGHISLQRYATTLGFKNLQIDLLPVEKKSVNKEAAATVEKTVAKAKEDLTPVVVDVRTAEEFRTGAYPGAINIPLDELPQRLEELGKNAWREITVYCASGARSAYAQRMLVQMGYHKVENGGGLTAMMDRGKKKDTPESVSPKAMVVDVRTPGEFRGGAVPGAINIPVDDLPLRINELGDKSGEIILYCASGARSAYGQKVLQQLGFTRVKNGGGIMQMMMNNNQ